MPPDSNDSATATAETFCLQAIQALPEAVKRYTGGDQAAFSQLKEKAVELAGGHIGERQISDALARKLQDGL